MLTDEAKQKLDRIHILNVEIGEREAELESLLGIGMVPTSAKNPGIYDERNFVKLPPLTKPSNRKTRRAAHFHKGCRLCGSKGPRHKNGCTNIKSKNSHEAVADVMAKTIQSLASIVGKSSAAMTQEQYSTLRESTHDREFNSKDYALDNEIDLREVNLACASQSYPEYLERRKEK